MTGDRVAHPLLISLANILNNIRTKSSYNAFALLALLPVPKFLHRSRPVRSTLTNRLTHACLDFILEPLKIGAAIGLMMSDPLGYLRYCFTPCAAYMVDTEEAIILASVAGKTSHLTLASYKQFGDAYQHPPRTGALTITQRHLIRSAVDPDADLAAYAREAMKYRLNGVDKVFWRDWPGAEPSTFLTTDPLHQWHKMFWDHDAKWCIRAVGSAEIDFRFALVPHRIGFRHFREGISKLKQVTGREHRDVQRYIIAVIAGAVSQDFLVAIRSLADFRYLGQAPTITDTICADITHALAEFHTHKQSILDAEARVGKGNHPIDNFYIPKLELMQSVVSNIHANGAIHQWSTDVTEHAHITEIKQPARGGNNQHYSPQICRALDRVDKIRRFELGTAILASGIAFGADADDDDESWSDDEDGDEDSPRIDTTSSLLASIDPTSPLVGGTRKIPDYFARAEKLLEVSSSVSHSLRTFYAGSTAFNLPRDPSHKRMSIEAVVEMFNLPDLRPALADFLKRYQSQANILSLGGRRASPPNAPLPFDELLVWSKFRIQLKAYHRPHQNLPPRTVIASPPSKDWPLGQYDTVLVNTDLAQQWPQSGIDGKLIHCLCC